MWFVPAEMKWIRVRLGQEEGSGGRAARVTRMVAEW